MHVIKHKWLFKKKPLDAKGLEFLCKARCVVRGDLQEAYVDFGPESLYAPVATHESLRLIIAFAANEDLILEGGDIANAYLYGELDLTIYMEQPTNSSRIEAVPGHVCAVDKSIYGTKQAGNIWGSLARRELISWGFKVSHFDARVYFLLVNGRFVVISIVVDDMSFASNCRKLLEEVKHELRATFDVKLLGDLSSFIGWNITRTPRGIKVDQQEYARTLLKKYGMERANAVRTPLPVNAFLLPASDDEALLTREDHAAYRAIIGGILYLAVCTRPDLSFPISVLARQMHAPTFHHFAFLKRILRYIAGTTNYGMHYARHGPLNPSCISAAVDADWGGDQDTRRSTTGYMIAINGSPIFWKSRRQTVIALSSAESEYVALSSCAKDVSWIRKLFWEICHQTPWSEHTTFAPTRIDIDSTAARSLATNAQVSAHNKHISLNMHHVRELLQNGVVELRHVASRLQPADLLTKVMTSTTLTDMLRLCFLNGY